MASRLVVEEATRTRPWMVMVHGMSQDHRVFSCQVDAFRSHYRILLIDLPGHGLASAYSGPFGHIEFADHMNRELHRRGVEDAIFWGTHTGASAGLLLAAIYANRIQRLILEGPVVPGDNPPVVLEAIETARQKARQEGIAAAIAGWWETGCWFEYMRAHPESCRAAEHLAIIKDFEGRPWLDDQPPKPVEDIGGLLAGVRIPVLIYNGIDDHEEFLGSSGHIVSLLNDAQRATVPRSGGFPAWENPKAVNNLVANFLD